LVSFRFYTISTGLIMATQSLDQFLERHGTNFDKVSGSNESDVDEMLKQEPQLNVFERAALKTEFFKRQAQHRGFAPTLAAAAPSGPLSAEAVREFWRAVAQLPSSVDQHRRTQVLRSALSPFLCPKV